MKNVDKVNIAKYLFLMASMLPIVKNATAAEKEADKLPYDGEYTLTVGAGFQHLLPSRIIDSQIKGKDLEGFNPGVYAEIGAMNWSGQHGKTDYEYHIGFFARFDYYAFHSRAYNVNDAINRKILEGETNPYVEAKDHGCANVRDAMGTFNIKTGFGWYGVVAEADCGLGFHFDNRGNVGPVIAFGTGLGYRFNQNFRLDAKVRVNVFPFEQFNSRNHFATTPGLRNSIELGLLYKLNSYYKGHEKKTKNNNRGKQR